MGVALGTNSRTSLDTDNGTLRGKVSKLVRTPRHYRKRKLAAASAKIEAFDVQIPSQLSM